MAIIAYTRYIDRERGEEKEAFDIIPILGRKRRSACGIFQRAGKLLQPSATAHATFATTRPFRRAVSFPRELAEREKRRREEKKN